MKKIAAIGEVLFDNIKGKDVLGGAPFNYIYHINRLSEYYSLGFHTAVISKIGNDPRGEKVREEFTKIGLPLNLLQISDTYETGIVNVNLASNGSAIYDISEQVAYDYIDFSPETKEFIASDMAFFYFGTLFQRSSHNRKTLFRCLPEENIFKQKVFFDINLRMKYYNWEIIDSSLLEADYLKINNEELKLLKNTYFAEKNLHYDRDFIDFLIETYVLDAVILTKAEKGAAIYFDEMSFWEMEGKICYNLKDTIGAGDAFSSIFTLGTLLGWRGEQILQRAIDFATEICKIEGAIPLDIAWYGQFKDWFSKA